MHKLIKALSGGALAGIMIAVGCSVYLSCDSKYIGALLFSVALITICICGFVLYTGKIGFMAFEHKKNDFAVLLLGLAANLVFVYIFSAAAAYAVPSIGESAKTLAEAKLCQSFLQTFVRAVFCGILMYIAVLIWRSDKRIIGVLFAIPVFILSGFEHSIADAGYLAAAGTPFIDWACYTGTVLLGNTAGSLLFAFIHKLYRLEVARDNT